MYRPVTPNHKRLITLPKLSLSGDSYPHFNRWADGECAKWLGYFIAKNHTLGVVHAWVAAFSGITKHFQHEILGMLGDWSMVGVATPTGFRMSFDLCMQRYDEEVDGLPSLPFNTLTTTIKGVQVIKARVRSMYPRRIWDICANTVIPATWFYVQDCPFTQFTEKGPSVWVRPISHAWAADGDRTYIISEANQQLWPIPLPKGIQLEDVRQEMIRLGVRYAWLDVLCLRQQAQPTLAKDLAVPVSEELVELVERREQRRLEEWKTDVPTIGAVYSSPEYLGLYGDGPIVIFMNGLGRPFRDEGWASERHWIRRAWSLQETPPAADWFGGECLIAGLPQGVVKGDKNVWPWNCKVWIYHSKFYATKLRHWHGTTQQIDDGQLLYSIIYNNNFLKPRRPVGGPGELPNLDALLRSIRQRHSSNLIDKVCALAFPLQRCMFFHIPVIFPIYDATTPSSVAWEQLISCIASTNMESENLCIPTGRESGHDELMGVIHTPTIQLLRLFHPSRHHWFPSWAQVQQYPDVSVRDNDLGPPTRGIDCSLHIVSGHIYHGCSLKLIQPPTPEKLPIYLCTMGGRSTQLAAIIPGTELHIDSTSKYVLVDISPDYSEWRVCKKTDVGHEHLPIWQESVVLVCEEVDPFPTVDTTCSVITESNITKYYLRRVTTLEWDCRLSAQPGPGRWMPFKPSLVHMRSVLCSALGAPSRERPYPTPGVFCDPAVVAGLVSQEGWHDKWEERLPVCEVYLV